MFDNFAQIYCRRNGVPVSLQGNYKHVPIEIHVPAMEQVAKTQKAQSTPSVFTPEISHEQPKPIQEESDLQPLFKIDLPEKESSKCDKKLEGVKCYTEFFSIGTICNNDKVAIKSLEKDSNSINNDISNFSQEECAALADEISKATTDISKSKDMSSPENELQSGEPKQHETSTKTSEKSTATTDKKTEDAQSENLEYAHSKDSNSQSHVTETQEDSRGIIKAEGAKPTILSTDSKNPETPIVLPPLSEYASHDDIVNELTKELEDNGFTPEEAKNISDNYFVYISNDFTSEEAIKGVRGFTDLYRIVANSNLSDANANKLLELYNKYFIETKSPEKAQDLSINELSNLGE